MPTAANQFEFDWLLAHASPLLSPSEAGHVLDCSDRHCADLLDEDRIRAIDIALDPTPSNDPEVRKLRTLRYWRWSVVHFAMRPDIALSNIGVADLLIHSRPFWLISEIARFLRCSEDHARNLYAEQAITGNDRNFLRNTAYASCRATRESLIHFLTSRTIKAH